MIAAQLAVVTVLSLLGSVSCKSVFGPIAQQPTNPPAKNPKPPPPAYSLHPPTYPPRSLSPPPRTPTYPLTSPSPPPHTPTYPPRSPSPSSPTHSYPPTNPSPPLPTPTYPPRSPSPPPHTPTYPLTSPSPSPHTPTYPLRSRSPSPPTLSYPPTSPSPPLPTPTYPPTSPSPLPPTPTYPPRSPSPSPPTPTYPPTSPSPPPPIYPQAMTPKPQPPAYPDPAIPKPPSYSQAPLQPPTYPSPPPTPTYPPTSPNPSPPTSPPPPTSSDDDPGKKLEVGYYINKCGPSVDVEGIVRKYVSGFDAGIQAGLIRLFFHDCFVRGCDASILVDETGNNDPSQIPEKFGIPNIPSTRGYEVIDAAKTEIEAKCPGVVSCADIVAFAARDASYFLSHGRISFDMPAGRYDGTVSLAGETLPNLPPPFAGYDQLKKMFAAKGLDAFDMVTLSGVHSVGRSHCSSFSRDRLPPSTTSDMDPAFAAKLQASCSSTNGTDDNTVMQDYKTPDDLDNQYYQNVQDHKVLFTSDAALTSDDMANYLVRVYAIYPWFWQDKFAEAMVKMGRIEIKTAATGEIRKMCGVVNKKP